MVVYNDAATLHRCMEQLFDWAFEAEGLADNLRASSTAFRFHLTDPDTTIFIDLTDAVVKFGDNPNIAADVALYMTADTAHRFWLGQVNVPLAVAKGSIKITGSKAKTLMLAPLMAPLSSKYTQILHEVGLDECLVDK